MVKPIYRAFSVYGIEIEYMIVAADTLDILPIADQLIETVSGQITNEFELGNIAVSNELALHVIELKTNGPTSSIAGANLDFFMVVKRLNAALKQWNAVLMPSGMHPWYAPTEDFKLWPHGDKTIYQAYHRIFNCRGHGWANLQSMHLNLPFGNEQEFIDLHSAIRLVLPLIPALAASTPYAEGKPSGYLDTRLFYYGKNQKSIPTIAGHIIPEFVRSTNEYHERILQPMFLAIAPHDAEKTLQEEWLNSRGAIARFERDAIEVRIIDSQECVQADLALAAFISLVIKDIMTHSHKYYDEPISEITLKAQYDACIKEGMNAALLDKAILQQLQIKPPIAKVQAIWMALYERVASQLAPELAGSITTIFNEGNLAARLLRFCGDNPDNSVLMSAYHHLATCLQTNRQFIP